MFLDEENIGISDVVITDCKATINKVDIPIKCIDVISKDKLYTFTFWTKQEYQKFNELELNKKTSIMDFIDDYDIDFTTEGYGTINSRENTKMYFTKLDKDKYLLNAEITDLNDCVLGNMKDHKNLKVEAIIDFNK